MSELNFLQSVAAYFSAGVPGRPHHDAVVYVLPNKRSAMFLKKYVRDTVKGVAMMPRFMTMRTFISLFAPYPEASDRELLFILYEAYRLTMQARGRQEGVREFDSFIFWGDMMLSDFDDIDRSMVNASDLFRNLRNVKEIQADYLDEDQKEVIRRVWGESRLTAEASGFWQHIHPDGDDAGMAAKFVYLWEILADVYHEYHRLLDEKKLASPGTQFRAALTAVKELAPYDITPDTHYAFVGFNDLTTVETLIFDRLKSLGCASFFWDTAAFASVGDNAEAMPQPLRRLRGLVRSFPMPPDYEVPLPASAPVIDVTAVPSNIGQAKAIRQVLSHWLDEKLIDTDDPLNTAVILPDQGLLLPAILAIPEDISKINISMGLPYRTTTFASLLSSIISMQLRVRDIRGASHFFFEDVNAVLAHPHIQLIARDQADAVVRAVAAEKLYNIPAADITAAAPELAPVFAPVRDLHSIEDVASYLKTLLDWLAAKIESAGDSNAGSFELQTIRFFREEVESLETLVRTYGVTMSDRTFLLMFERIFNARGITVNGTPLAGLQMLGVLETRALDFDNVIVLSMNEHVFPRKQYTRTMIPNALRAGFGLPDFETLEWTYAYCFYRLMARARNVELFYDSRTDGSGNGEVSRYVSQMRYLMPTLKVDMHAMSYASNSDGRPGITLEKNAEIMEVLDGFRAGGPLRLSASALKTYKSCPMRFYLEYGRRMRAGDELVDYISASEFGTVVHNVIQELYEGLPSKVIDAQVIDGLLDPANPAVDQVARRQLIRERYPKATDADNMPLTAEAQLACRLVAKIARDNLVAEKDFYCAGGRSFTFMENEFKVNKPWHIADGLDVNFYMSIDRFDRTDSGRLRFVDFKTGDDDFKVDKVAGLFNRNTHDKDGIFQLFTYAQAYLDIVDSSADIMPVLHPMRRLTGGAPLEPISVGGKPVLSYAGVRDDFEPLLKNLISEIFDPDVPLTQCEKVENCRFCPFITLCGRVTNKN